LFYTSGGVRGFVLSHNVATTDFLAMSPNDEQREPSVLADLPRARPQMRSNRRGSAKPRKAAPAKPAATTKAAGAVAKAATKPKPAATKPKPAAAKPKPAATKPRKAAPAKPGPTAKTAVPTAKPAEPVAPPRKSDDQPFVTTALQAAGELAQIGIAVGARAVRNALDRLPKP
jgi:hypothetical protein